MAAKKKTGIYRDRQGKYRWRVVAENGKILGASSEGFTRRIDCLRNAGSTQRALRDLLHLHIDDTPLP